MIDSNLVRVWAKGYKFEQMFERELAKQNYLNIHKKRGKK